MRLQSHPRARSPPSLHLPPSLLRCRFQNASQVANCVTFQLKILSRFLFASEKHHNLCCSVSTALLILVPTYFQNHLSPSPQAPAQPNSMCLAQLLQPPASGGGGGWRRPPGPAGHSGSRGLCAFLLSHLSCQILSSLRTEAEFPPWTSRSCQVTMRLSDAAGSVPERQVSSGRSHPLKTPRNSRWLWSAPPQGPRASIPDTHH